MAAPYRSQCRGITVTIPLSPHFDELAIRVIISVNARDRFHGDGTEIDGCSTFELFGPISLHLNHTTSATMAAILCTRTGLRAASLRACGACYGAATVGASCHAKRYRHDSTVMQHMAEEDGVCLQLRKERSLLLT